MSGISETSYTSIAKFGSWYAQEDSYENLDLIETVTIMHA